MHAGIQWWGAKRLGVILRPRAGWHDSEVRRTIRAALTSSGYTSLYNIVFLVMLVVAGMVPGGAIAFQIGHQFSVLPVALGAVPLAAAQLPLLSHAFVAGDMIKFNSTLARSAALTRFVSLPAALLLLTNSDILAQAVAFGQMATATGVCMIAVSVASLGPGVFGDAALVVATSASYARREPQAPFRAIVLRAAIASVGIVLALWFMHGVSVLWTLGASVSLANLAAAAYLGRCLARDLKSSTSRRSSRIFGELASAAIAVAPCLVVAVWLQGDAGNHYQRISVALASIVIGALLYLAVQWMRGSHELKSLISVLHRRNFTRPPEEAL
jgi:putative peptidoglycan lipid II flippase